MGSTRTGPNAGPKLVRPSTIIGLTSMGGNAQSSSPSGVTRNAQSVDLSNVPPCPMAVQSLRNLSPTYRNSPKFEMDLQDLSNLPPAPAFKGVQRRTYNPPNSNAANNT